MMKLMLHLKEILPIVVTSVKRLPWNEGLVTQREYISPEIINEIITIMGQSVLREILSENRSSLWFSVIADEATDIPNNEQMSISICYVDTKYDIHEETIGLIQLPNTTAQTLFGVMKDVLLRCSLPIAQCVG